MGPLLPISEVLIPLELSGALRTIMKIKNR